MQIQPVIMAGGTGSRLWPLSRELYPKQFLNVSGDLSMLQETLRRLDGLEHSPPLLICNEEHRFLASEQVKEGNFSNSGIILEPFGRNTAPAIALAAFEATKQSKGQSDPILLVLAADHLIQDIKAFHRAVYSAIELAKAGSLVTFGIVPHAPETGYGYIKRGNKVESSEGYGVDSFVEKPDLATAQEYLDSGDYYWNSGMFMFKASVYLEALKLHCPTILDNCKRAYEGAKSDLDFIRVDEHIFSDCPDESIDYAVMEKTTKAMVVPMDACWNDVGSWSALWDISSKDDLLNVCKGDIIHYKTNDSYLHSEGKLIAAVGVNNLIVVETKDAVLVADKSKVQDVKYIVNELKQSSRKEYRSHREAYRVWGKQDSLDEGCRDSVKRLTVKPGEYVSSQQHHHRAEHWIVVAGTAKVTIGERTFLLTENESTFIPIGEVHSLENPGKIPLELIEVQTGHYLGEDDIVRFESRTCKGEGLTKC